MTRAAYGFGMVTDVIAADHATLSAARATCAARPRWSRPR